ncbi:tripartite tricarboxylate transporter substrate binding protein [Sphaerotilus sp.]|uniref:Bug family tripartite tricarboxylate transporter substrate binding protein n=1 Tax=Sphaerotilus sp. TaxID=2093942 RepID=UPI002ACF0409|nr:tripartite tricarboxylate transporter substrate binding protein [Sphaerotilus sp.]MDZ7857706.1 tripartite tricarboxylate transporter substrate binding protein [Sphaerotilus sp.]
MTQTPSPSFLPLNRRHALGLTGLGLLGTLAVGLPAAAQTAWPTKPMTLVVPFPAGGGTDAFARPLSAVLSKQLGQQLVIDNKGGAGGNLGAGVAAKAAPDGYTWFMGAVHHAIAPAVYPKLDYNLLNDFIPVALVSSVPQVIVVNPQKVPAKNLNELLAFIRSKPGQLTYGSAGNGSSHHLAGELFKMQTKTFITHIPYRGAGPALQDLMGGQIDMMFDGLGSSATHIKSGRLRAIAVAGDKRAPGFPDIPTAAEAGVPTYKVATWYGLWAPKGTPKDVVDKMSAELKTALGSPELKTTWNSIGSETPTMAGKEFGDFVAAETKRWADVVKAGNIKLE